MTDLINQLRPFMLDNPIQQQSTPISPPIISTPRPTPAPTQIPAPIPTPTLKSAPNTTSYSRPQKTQQHIPALTRDPLLQCLAELHEPTYVKFAKLRTQQQRNNDNVTKLEFIPLLRDPALKSTLWARDTKYASLIETESDLTSSTPITLATFLTLCRMLKVAPFLVIYKNTYYVFGQGLEDSTAPLPQNAVVFCDNDGHRPFWKYVATYKTPLPLYRIDKITKPYRAVSSYKIADLRNLCTQLEIITAESGNIPTKPELYAKLKLYFAPLSVSP